MTQKSDLADEFERLSKKTDEHERLFEDAASELIKVKGLLARLTKLLLVVLGTVSLGSLVVLIVSRDARWQSLSASILGGLIASFLVLVYQRLIEPRQQLRRIEARQSHTKQNLEAARSSLEEIPRIAQARLAEMTRSQPAESASSASSTSPADDDGTV